MKITVVGAGSVGTEVCSYLFYAGNVSELVLIDVNKEKALAEIMDFSHATSFTHTKNIHLTAGDYPQSADSDIVVITAGAQIKQGQTREELAQINTDIVSSIAQKLYSYSPDAIVINVTNPVDLISYMILKNSGYQRHQVISTGTVLDTARLMRILGEKLGVDPKNVFGYVLGEHGQTSFIPWSLCNVVGMGLDEYCRLNGHAPIDRDWAHDAMLNAGFEIFKRKNNTSHGIAATVFRIIRAVELDENSVLPAGVLLRGEYGLSDVVLNVPVVIGRRGLLQTIEYQLPQNEADQLRKSFDHQRAMIETLN